MIPLIPYRFTYLIGSVIFMIPWLILYLLRKDIRAEMLMMSILMAFASFITGYLFWTIDWWQPETITGTKVGIEDLILGFANGGVAAAIYEEIFKKHFSRRRHDKNKIKLVILILFSIIFIFYLFYIIRLTSFLASAIVMTLFGILILYLRRDLVLDAIVSGLLMAIVSIPVYLILEIVSPGWIDKTWLYSFLSEIKILGIPIEDLIFYFLAGFIAGPFYETWQGYRLIESEK